MIFDLISGFLSIASIAQETTIHSQTQTHNHASQIDNQAQIAANHPMVSDHKSWNAIINQYIAADSTRAIQRIVIVKKNPVIFGFFHIFSSDFQAKIHSQIQTHNHASQTANQAQT